MINQHILLTGATGILGHRILFEILHNSSLKVTCVLRASKKVSFSERSRIFVEEVRKKFLSVNIETRLFIIEGDITKEKWGISLADQKILLLIDSIIHAAADVSLDLSDEEAEKNIMNSCREMLDIQSSILKSGRDCKVDYVSTVGVLGCSRFPLREEICLETRKFHNTYEAYKAKAEALVFEIKSHDPQRQITIHRPSMIVGDSATGEIGSFQIFYFILSLFVVVDNKKRSSILPPVLDFKIDTIPVDIVARGIFYSCLHRSPVFILNHCTGPEESWSIRKIVELMEKRGLPIRRNTFLPNSVFRIIFLIMNFIFFRNKKIKKIIGLYSSLLEYTRISPAFLNDKTLIYYHEAGINLPKPDDYMSKIIDYYVTKKRRAI